MSATKKRALHHRLAFVALAASEYGLLTGYAGFPPSDSRIIVRLENEGLIIRIREKNSVRTSHTVFKATDKGLAALAAAGMKPSTKLPDTGELHETPASRRTKMMLAQRFDPAYQAAKVQKRQRIQKALAELRAARRAPIAA